MSDRWQLLVGIQSSLIGQFVLYMQAQASTDSSSSTIASANWAASMLEGVNIACEGTRIQRVPFIVKTQKAGNASGDMHLSCDGDQNEIFQLFINDSLLQVLHP
jgi:hypothetical protein